MIARIAIALCLVVAVSAQNFHLNLWPQLDGGCVDGSATWRKTYGSGFCQKGQPGISYKLICNPATTPVVELYSSDDCTGNAGNFPADYSNGKCFNPGNGNTTAICDNKVLDTIGAGFVAMWTYNTSVDAGGVCNSMADILAADVLIQTGLTGPMFQFEVNKCMPNEGQHSNSNGANSFKYSCDSTTGQITVESYTQADCGGTMTSNTYEHGSCNAGTDVSTQFMCSTFVPAVPVAAPVAAPVDAPVAAPVAAAATPVAAPVAAAINPASAPASASTIVLSFGLVVMSVVAAAMLF